MPMNLLLRRLFAMAFSLVVLSLLFVAFAQDTIIPLTAQDAVVQLPAPTFTDNLWDMGVKSVLAIGALFTAFIGTVLSQYIGQRSANEVRLYMNQVMERIVITWLGRVAKAQNAVSNNEVKNEIIDGAAVDIIKAIPDALNHFRVPLDPNSKKLRDMIESRITEQLLKLAPAKTLAAPDPHGDMGNGPDDDDQRRD